jgi:DNA-binding response OmpR family regulator
VTIDARDALTIGNVEILADELQVLVDGRRIGFTVREFETFFVLAARADHVVRRAEIHELVYGRPMARRDRSVDVFVRKVRQKLALAAPEWTFIHTHFGIGYRFAPEPVAQAACTEPAS